jgi:hypothetical protein
MPNFNPATTAGPNQNGSKSLAPESRAGLGVALVGTLLIDGALGGILENIQNVDTSGWTGWWVTLVSAGLATVAGLITAYRKRNTVR